MSGLSHDSQNSQTEMHTPDDASEATATGQDRFTAHKTAKVPEMEFVELFMHFFEKHDVKGIDFLSKLETQISFKETTMLIGDFLDELDGMFKSFPDMSFEARDIKVIAPGKVEVGFFQTNGTHTGKPYGFGPYPEVPTSNIKFKNDPERFVFEVEDGKLNKLTVIPTGEYSGPMGAYLQIGGFPC